MLSKATSSLLINLSLAALVIYCLTIFRYAYNMPVGDDYDAILRFLNQYVSADWSSRFRLIFSQHNEHRLVLTRAFSAIDFSIFGKINFSHLIWLGLLGWILAIFTFWHFSHQSGISFVQFTPVMILLVSFSHFDIMTWAVGSTQQYFQILFVILSIGYMTNGRLSACLIFFTCAVFTSGGGLGLAPLIILYFATEKKWGKLVVSLSISALIFFIYFSLLSYVSPTPNKTLETIFLPYQWIGYFLGFLGGWSNISKLGLASILLGGACLLTLFALTAKRSRARTPFFFWLSTYIVITATLTALNRSDLGLITSGDSRYSQYSLLFLSCIYLGYIGTEINERRKLIILLGFALFSMVIFSYWYIQALRPLEDRLYWLKNDLQVHPSWQDALSVREESVKLGVFGGK